MKKLILIIFVGFFFGFMHSTKTSVCYMRYTRINDSSRIKNLTVTIDTTLELLKWNDSYMPTKVLKRIVNDFFNDEDDRYILIMLKNKQGVEGFSLFGESGMVRDRLIYGGDMVGVLIDTVNNRQKVLYVGVDKDINSIFIDCFENSGLTVDICTVDSTVLKSDSIFYTNTNDFEYSRNELTVALIDDNIMPLYFKRRNILYADYHYPEIEIDYSEIWDSIIGGDNIEKRSIFKKYR